MATGGALGSLPAETFLFQALLKLQDEFHVPVEEIQNSIQSSYSMLAEFNKMRGTGDMCTGCGNMHPEAEPLTFEAMQNWEAPGFPWADKVDHVLKTVFNHEQFRPNQRKVINCVLSGRDAFVIMPTGAGKSLLYQLPGVISNGFTLVISPLLSLIQDQVSALRKKGVVAVELSSSRTPKEVSQMLKTLAKDTNVKFLFVTPERVVKSTRFFAFLRQQVDQARLARVVIDECHCISQWGYDFRPDFKQLLVLRKEFPKVPILALTSSATNRCKVDTMRQLGLEECDFFTQSFNRPNLRYAVENKTKKTTKKIIQFIKKKHNSESGIIYCLSKKECEAMARKLQAAKIQANFYHAGLSPAKREKVQRKWMAGEFAVMVATIAFGLGIDKADVRFVIHHSLPRTIEDFYQESGRAGRDGLNADCVVFYRHSDRPRHTFMQLSSCKNAFQARTKLEKMRQLTAWCEDHTRCRRELLLEYFGEAFTGGACCNGMCDNCLFGARAVALDWCRQAQAVVRIVGSLGDKATMANVVSVVRGCTTPTVRANGWHSLPDFGADTSASELACRRLVQWMTLNNFLLEQPTLSSYKTALIQLVKGGEADALLDGRAKAQLSYYEESFIEAAVLNRGQKRKASTTSSASNSNHHSNSRKKVKRTKADDDDLYEVEQVLARRQRKGRTEYLVKWKGWDDSHDSWVAADECACDELVAEFEDELRSRRETKKRSRPEQKHQSLETDSTPSKGKEKASDESDVDSDDDHGRKRRKRSTGEDDDDDDEGDWMPEGDESILVPEGEGEEEPAADSVAGIQQQDELIRSMPTSSSSSSSSAPAGSSTINTPIRATEPPTCSSTSSAFDLFLQMPLNCTIKRKRSPAPGGAHQRAKSLYDKAAPAHSPCSCAKPIVPTKNAVTPLVKKGNELMMDLVFSFDTTGSMYHYVGEVKTKVEQIVEELLRDVPNIRIGLIAHGDYCATGVWMGGHECYVTRELDFTSDRHALCSFIRNTHGSLGGDDEGECYELALWQSRQFSWRPGSTKALVMIGDDLPHTPDFPGNTRRLDWRAEVDQLKADGVTIYSVHAGGKPASRGPRTRFWREMAERTGGEYLTLASIASIHETMVGILYREAGDQQLEHWAKTAGGSTTAASGEAHVFLTSTMKELSLSTDDLMRIHEALHDKGVGEVEALGRRHAVVVGRAGCRFVRIEGVTFIEQNKNKASKYARMATEGKKITWVVKLGEWGLIIDGEVVKM